MPYQVYWDAPKMLLYLKLTGDVSLQEFVEIDRDITHYLASYEVGESIALLVDVKDAKSVPQSFNQLRTSQTYAYEYYQSKLSHILVVSGNNKLMRLMMMLTFNLCRPSLQFFEAKTQALSYFHKCDVGSHILGRKHQG